MLKNYDYSKSLIRIAVLAIFTSCACFFINVTAQQNSFSDEELEVFKKNARQKLKGIKYRKETVREYFNKKSPFDRLSQKETIERLPPNRSRYYFEEYNSLEKTIDEQIHDEKVSYRNKNNEGWKKFVRDSNYRGTGYRGLGRNAGSGTGPAEGFRYTKTVRYDLKKDEELNGRKLNLYEKTTKYIYFVDSVKYSATFTGRYWFDADGRFVKTEDYFEHERSGKISREISEYDYDSKIEIKIPIIDKEKSPNFK